MRTMLAETRRGQHDSASPALSENLLPDPIPADPANVLAFRQAMGRFATGVAIVAFTRGDGSIGAMTINSLVSVSLDPMLVSWSLQNSSSQFGEFSGAPRFSFSILAADQQALARRYAARGDSAFNQRDFTTSPNGSPVIAGALAYLECTRWAVHPAGDHTLILGEVTAFAGASDQSALGFFSGRFCRIGD